MLRHLSELLVHTSNLLEAEGRTLRRSIGRLGVGLSYTVVSAALLLGGCTLLMVALWIGVASNIGPAWASAITGAVALALGFAALKLAERYHG